MKKFTLSLIIAVVGILNLQLMAQTSTLQKAEQNLQEVNGVNLAPPPTVPDLIITEISYNPPESGSDSLEFIEIYNNETSSVNLGGLTFTQGVTYTFPSISLAAGSYFVLAVDSVKLNNFFNISAYEWTSGGLSNGGEDILIVTATGDTVDYVDYDDNTPWPTSPDGGGPSLNFCNLSLDNNMGANWSAATTFVGTNANGDSIWANPGTGCVSGPPVSDTIPPIALSATVLTDTTIVVAFNEAVGPSAIVAANYSGLGTLTAVKNATGFEVTLTLANALVSTASNTLVISNVKDTSNNVMTPQSFPIVWNNSITDIVISEIMYNDVSKTDSLEYFEVYNNGAATANLGGYAITEGVVYTFPAGTTLDAGKYLVIAKDSALVNAVFGITGTHQWISGGLKNSGEDICILNTAGDTIDYVDYSDSSPWPDEADGDGPSLEFCNKSLDNNVGANWSFSLNFVATFNGDSIFGTPGTGCVVDGIENNSNKANVTIYPNPAKNTLNINTDGKEYQVRIYNISGGLVQDLSINKTTTTISLQGMTSGMYYIQFVDIKTGNTAFKKLIIE